jgi:hypothetical protein
MSKTPLTDHYTKRLRNLCDDEFVPIEFARKLERELAAMTEQRDFWKAGAERWREAADESFQTRAWKQLIEEEKNRMRSRLEYMVGEDWGSKLSKSE